MTVETVPHALHVYVILKELLAVSVVEGEGVGVERLI